MASNSSAMTANSSWEDRERCLAVGMVDFIVKPVQPETLYAVIAKWILLLPMQQLADKATASASAIGEQVICAPATDPRIIDLQVLAVMVRNDPLKIRKFGNDFIESAWGGINQIETALDNRESSKLSALGHRIKSMARSVGAQGLGDLCLQLEELNHGGDLVAAQEIVAQLRPLMQKIVLEMDAYFKSKE